MSWTRILPLKAISVAAIATSLGGCTMGLGYGYDDYGYNGYSDSYYCDPYDQWDSYYNCDYNYGYNNIGYTGGWWNNYYYPGFGVYIFDNGGRRYQMDDNHRRHWGRQRYDWGRTNGHGGRGRGDGHRGNDRPRDRDDDDRRGGRGGRGGYSGNDGSQGSAGVVRPSVNGSDRPGRTYTPGTQPVAGTPDRPRRGDGRGRGQGQGRGWDQGQNNGAPAATGTRPPRGDSGAQAGQGGGRGGRNVAPPTPRAQPVVVAPSQPAPAAASNPPVERSAPSRNGSSRPGNPDNRANRGNRHPD